MTSYNNNIIYKIEPLPFYNKKTLTRTNELIKIFNNGLNDNNCSKQVVNRMIENVIAMGEEKHITCLNPDSQDKSSTPACETTTTSTSTTSSPSSDTKKNSKLANSSKMTSTKPSNRVNPY